LVVTRKPGTVGKAAGRCSTFLALSMLSTLWVLWILLMFKISHIALSLAIAHRLSPVTSQQIRVSKVELPHHDRGSPQRETHGIFSG
jgi:hypothetical protein